MSSCWHSSLEILNSQFEEMFNAIFIGALKRLHRAKERKNLFNGEQGSFVIAFGHGGFVDFSLLIVAEGLAGKT
jgi:hypothetical protein